MEKKCIDCEYCDTEWWHGRQRPVCWLLSEEELLFVDVDGIEPCESWKEKDEDGSDKG